MYVENWLYILEIITRAPFFKNSKFGLVLFAFIVFSNHLPLLNNERVCRICLQKIFESVRCCCCSPRDTPKRCVGTVSATVNLTKFTQVWIKGTWTPLVFVELMLKKMENHLNQAAEKYHLDCFWLIMAISPICSRWGSFPSNHSIIGECTQLYIKNSCVYFVTSNNRWVLVVAVW